MLLITVLHSKIQTIPYIQKSEEWFNIRRQYATASEIGNIFETIGSKKELWDLKKGITSFVGNSATEYGIKRELIIFQKLKQEQPNIQEGKSFVRGFLMASLDAMDEQQQIIYEIKAPFYPRSKRWQCFFQTKKIQQYYYLQIQTQLLVTGAQKVIFVVENKHDNHELTSVEIYPDRPLWESIVTKAHEFLMDLKKEHNPYI